MTSTDDPTVLVPPSPPAVARTVFGPYVDKAAAYAELLAGPGVLRGLIGPREVPRLWERHLLNCAVVAELLDAEARLVDVGSGAGLPGIVLAVLRPDLAITLVEPLARRVVFLEEAVATLPVPGVRIVRGRAEEPAVRALVAGADVATARAVSSLGHLAEWCLPLLRPGGRLLAIKGASAGAELARDHDGIRRLGGVSARVLTCGAAVLPTPTTVVEIVRGTAGASAVHDPRAARPRAAGPRAAAGPGPRLPS